MISKAVIEAVIKQAKQVDKDAMLAQFIIKLGNYYSYNDDKVNHCLELLLGGTNPVTSDKIDMDYIKKNFNKYIYKPEEYIIKDIELKSIDNIEGIIYVDYKYKQKINEYNDNIDFDKASINISFIDYKEVLK